MQAMAIKSGALAISAAAWISASAQAVTFDFINITGNNAANAAIGEAQFKLDVTDAGMGMVSFLFTNTSPDMSPPDPATITQTYWDDAAGVLDSIAMIDNSLTAGVSFSAGGAPPNLPGGGDIADPFSADFRATADSPPALHGVDPDEALAVKFNIAGGLTFDDVIDALSARALRVGVHAQSIGQSGDSESFINWGGTVTPMPTGAALGVAGLLAVGSIRRRRFA